MKWRVPAKTFLIGEYAATQQGPSIVLTTTPCFELELTHLTGDLENIHPNSPAGCWYENQTPLRQGLKFIDPYQALGGLGASTAQFVSVFIAYHQLNQLRWDRETLLQAYFKHAYHGQGKKPSGHDLLAQTHSNCVLFDGHSRTPHAWPFKKLAFSIIRTGKKLATHEHLTNLTNSFDYECLYPSIYQTITAFKTCNSHLLITSINDFSQQLINQSLCATYTIELIEQLKKNQYILAAKGCGAMGADFIIVIHEKQHTPEIHTTINQLNLTISATQESLFT